MVNDYTLPDSGMNNASPNAPMYGNGSAIPQSTPSPKVESGNLNVGAVATEKFNKVLSIIAVAGLLYFGYRIYKAYQEEKEQKIKIVDNGE
jgi:hypothetical protein